MCNVSSNHTISLWYGWTFLQIAKDEVLELEKIMNIARQFQGYENNQSEPEQFENIIALLLRMDICCQCHTVAGSRKSYNY